MKIPLMILISLLFGCGAPDYYDGRMKCKREHIETNNYYMDKVECSRV